MKKFVKKTIAENSFYPILLLLIFFSWGCKKEQIVLISPSIEIKSALATALTTYHVVVETKVGEGQKIEKAEVIFKDITVNSAPDILQGIQINDNKNQIDTITIKTNRLAHDYSVQASLTTDKYTYTSEQKIIRSAKNNFSIDVLPNYIYTDLNNHIADFVNKGSSFSLKVDYLNVFKPKSVEVKLNRTIPLKHTLDFKNYWFGDNIETTGSVSVPQEIEEGVYEVYVYLDGVEFKTKNNIKILKGSWQKIDPKYPGDKRGQYAWFVKDDNIFLFGGYGSSKIPVLKYNILNNSWERKLDFRESIEPGKCQILSSNLQYNNKAYILFRNNENIEIWNYENETDKWSLVTQYPGKAIEYFTSFISKGKIFLGGGSRYNQKMGHYDYYYDLWEYDLDSNNWIQKNNLPIKFTLEQIERGGGGTLSSVVNENNVYVFSYSNDFWQYHPDTDSWSQKKKFPGHLRIISNLIEKNNKLYLIGGLYLDYGYVGLKDCWEYTVSSNSWEMVAFMPELYANGIAFTFNDHIYAGLGWVINGYGSFYEQNFYQLDL